MNKHDGEIVEFFKSYMLDINERGLQAITDYFNAPSFVISQDGVSSLASNKEVAAFFQPQFDAMESQGFTRAEATEMNVKVLSDNAAIASNVVVRYKQDGSELNRTAITYTLHKNSHGWKIAVLMLHDPDKVIQIC